MEELDLGWLAVPVAFAIGFLIGRRVTHRTGMTISAIAGAIAYPVGLTVFADPLMPFQFLALEIFLQILLAALGAVCSLMGWYIGANFEFIRKWRKITPKPKAEKEKPKARED